MTVFKTLKKGISESLAYEHDFYSCGRMIFTWDMGFMKIWFECEPDLIPSELLPSDKCRIKEYTTEAEKRYTIVCDNMRGEE